MIIIQKNTPSKEAKLLLDALQQAVTKTLDKKRRLGHYAVMWDGGKPMMRGEDSPCENNDKR